MPAQPHGLDFMYPSESQTHMSVAVMEAILVAAAKEHSEVSTNVGSHPVVDMPATSRVGIEFKQLGKQVIVNSTANTESVGMKHNSLGTAPTHNTIKHQRQRCIERLNSHIYITCQRSVLEVKLLQFLQVFHLDRERTYKGMNTKYKHI